MTLNLIGIGLGNSKDITVKGLELVKKSDFVYLENYTSKLNCSVSELEELYGKKIVLADRDMVENSSEIIDKAKDKQVSLLIIGDVFSATTHLDIINRAKEVFVEYRIVNNTSVLTAVGVTGLSLYNFGKVTSIPFDNKNVVSPIKVFEENYSVGMHTLFLLDLKPEENKFMNANMAIKYLIEKGIDQDKMGVVCLSLGSDLEKVKYGKLKDLTRLKFDSYPQCLIIPGNLHFVEEECLNSFKI
jgi:diphthine synthase